MKVCILQIERHHPELRRIEPGLHSEFPYEEAGVKPSVVENRVKPSGLLGCKEVVGVIPIPPPGRSFLTAPLSSRDWTSVHCPSRFRRVRGRGASTALLEIA